MGIFQDQATVFQPEGTEPKRFQGKEKPELNQSLSKISGRLKNYLDEC